MCACRDIATDPVDSLRTIVNNSTALLGMTTNIHLHTHTKIFSFKLIFTWIRVCVCSVLEEYQHLIAPVHSNAFIP